MQNSQVSSLRVGIVGAGRWAEDAHLPAFRRVEGVGVVALCDIDPDRAAAVAGRAGIPAVYTDVARMLESEHLDAISVVTPDDAHVRPVMLALDRGVHVLCEKPLATSIDAAAQLEARARASGLVTRMGFTMRSAPAMQALRSLVTGGVLGPPHLLQAFQQNAQFLDPAAPFHWKMNPVRSGGGAIVEYGIHTLDLARWIMGEATAVSATSLTQVAERSGPGGKTVPVEVDDSTAWLMEFDGAIGVLHAGWSTVGRPPGVEVRVFGSRGAARCVLSDDLPDAEGLWVAGPDGVFHPHAYQAQDDPGGPWWTRFPVFMIREFVDAIRGVDGGGASFEDGLRAQLLLDAVQRSVSDRGWMTPQLRPVTQS